jgi:hypothetical protein
MQCILLSHNRTDFVSDGEFERLKGIILARHAEVPEVEIPDAELPSGDATNLDLPRGKAWVVPPWEKTP